MEYLVGAIVGVIIFALGLSFGTNNKKDSE